MPARQVLRRPFWRSWVLHLALLCFIGLHSVGLLHHHDSQADYDACVVHQAVDHQTPDEPGLGALVLFSLVVLFFLRGRWRSQTVRSAAFFPSARSRAPPFRFAS